MDRPLKEHYITETDAGDTLQTFRYIEDLDKYCDQLASERYELEEDNEQTWENRNNQKQAQEIQYEQMNTKIGRLEQELQTLKDAVKEMLKKWDKKMANKQYQYGNDFWKSLDKLDDLTNSKP